ncbi:MAG: carboxypeptidase-like regulatory domain-containing protein [Cytophagales bacterium]
MKRLFTFSIWGIALNVVFAQSYTQTLRGTVQDKVTLSTLPGVLVLLDDSLATETDSLGNFKFENVPVGVHNLLINYESYKSVPLQNISVNSGKEVVLTIPMEENITELKSIVLETKLEKNKPLNSMSTVSTRVFSVEETQKYAAAVNDPARMATAFAGVIATDDGNNGISIRGNSPNGLLWRVEGVDVPNPNHFANVGTSGGGVSILSTQLLNNSDFSTGAFASEYGNALSGVFDIRLRKGNNQKREYTFRAGFLGLDAAVEGPFKKGYEGSYLINYRYSTLGIISKIIPDIIPNTLFQDLSYNIYLPTNKYGKFTFFGFNGLSSQGTKALKDSAEWDSSFKRWNSTFKSNTLANGITYSNNINKKLHLKSALVLSRTYNGFVVDQLNYDYQPVHSYDEKHIQNKLTFNTVLNYKINAKNSLRAGAILNQYDFKVFQQRIVDSSQLFNVFVNQKGNSASVQSFAQWQYRVNEKLTLNSGLHYLLFALNKTQSLEPRLSAKYEINAKNAVSIGYGLHSQIQPIAVYFAQAKDANGNETQPNKNLKLSRAHHFVVGYDKSINAHTRLKLESYYQYLFHIPQGNSTSENYSILNEQGGNVHQVLNSNGTGRNYGLELTAERFMYKNFYLLSTVSLYDSKYKGNDGKMYNTRFNGNYAFTLTTGKDFQLSAKHKNKVIGFNIKSYYTGGFRYSPIDLNASIQSGEQVDDMSKAFSIQNPAYFRTDIRVSMKRNFKKVTTTLALDIQNVSNRKNVGGQFYNEQTKKIEYWYSTPLIPILSYKVEF